MGQRRGVFFAIAFMTFVTLGIAGGLVNIAWIQMQDTFNVQLDALGILLLFATIGSLIATFGSGTFIGRFKLGPVLLIGAILNLAGLLGYAIAPTWFALLLFTTVLSMGRATLDAGINNFVSVHYGATAMNWLHAGWGIGLTFAPTIITFILLNLQLSWRVSYGLVAIVLIVLVLIFALTLRNWDISKRKTDSDDITYDIAAPTMRESLMQPMVRWSLLLFFLYCGIEIGTGQLANTLLVESRGITQQVSAFWISLYWGSFTVGRMLIGFIALRLSANRILQLCFGLTMLGATLLTVSAFPILTLVALMCLGLGLSAIFPILISQTPARVGLQHTPNAIGFQIGLASFGATVLPGVLAFLSVHTGLETISYGIFICAILLLIIYFLLLQQEAKRKLATA